MTTATAQQAFDQLPTTRRLALLEEVFNFLEYQADGTPGPEWGPDTTMGLGCIFDNYGIVFTNPDDARPTVEGCDECGAPDAPRAAIDSHHTDACSLHPDNCAARPGESTVLVGGIAYDAQTGMEVQWAQRPDPKTPATLTVGATYTPADVAQRLGIEAV